MALYYGRNHQISYSLSSRLGGGGEGEVYEIIGNNNLVAKIYFDSKFNPTPESQNPRQELKEKIETMLDQPVDPYINGVLSIAWPQDILYDQQGMFVGYTMPRVNSKHKIFAASRKREREKLYPSYNWKTAILIAYNLCLAVSVIHKTGAVVGDMNPNNIMLDEKGHITLIDTDSFNIKNIKTGKEYKCSVGVSEVLPPELQGKNLAKATSQFTEHTDNFALAIHIFNLLMNNCHPFGCIGLNKSQSSSSSNAIVRNIVKGNCPYVTNGKGNTSPDAPDYMMLPLEVRQLFDRVFSYSASTAVQSATISNRPSADEWKKVLEKLYYSKMNECKKDTPHIHLYPSSYSTCPWCAIQKYNVPPPNPQPQPQPPMPTPPSPNNNVFSNINSFMIGNYMGTYIRREPWPLWITCILMGLFSAPVLSRVFFVDFVNKTYGIGMSNVVSSIILAIFGAFIGAVIAFFGQESFQKAYNAWPWLALGLAVPVATALVAAILSFVIFLIVIIVMGILGLVLGVLLGAIVIAACIGSVILVVFCLKGLCSDMLH